MRYLQNKKHHCAMVLMMSATLSASSVADQGNANGSLALGGDFWQTLLESVLNVPSISASTNITANEKPFYVPQAKSHGLTTFRDMPVSLTLRAKHILPGGAEDNNLDFEIVTQPLHGTLQGQAPNLTYVPNAGYTGFDKVTFRVDDGVDGTTDGNISIKVLGSYTAFESGQVRPLALNADATRLYALNTPDGKLEIYDVSSERPEHLHSVSVGLEPVAIALNDNNEAWVVNTLSDNVSIVDIGADVPYVKNTLQVGDEPQDIVFAGPNKQRAFISTAHRGQNSPMKLEPMTPGIDRADVWVFDASQTNANFLKIVTLFGMSPRGLAVSPDGQTVYAGIYKSGNQSTIVVHNYRLGGKNSTANGKPGPKTDTSGVKAPNTGVIVRHNGKHWVDQYGTNWDRWVQLDLPDHDVFEIDAMAASPQIKKKHAHVGNTLFNLCVNPKSGALYVSNLEARNELKFEGHGERSDIQTLRGRFVENRITVIKDGNITPRNLNPHLSDERPDGSAEDNARSLALPLQMQVNGDGDTLYVAAYGSSKVGVFNVTQLEQNNVNPSPIQHIDVSGGGPAGLVLDESRDRLYVLTRFDNGISIIDTARNTESAHVQMYNPEPDFIVKGRPLLYDARFSSGRGDASCGSCHLFGDTDGIAWDLGNPDERWSYNPRGYVSFFFRMNALRVHHPLKGPMLTQSLRGMEFQGPQHWRGDRTGSHRINGESLEKAAFKEFRVAFPGLLARAEQPTEDQLNAFADFVLQLHYPPNPIRNLDESLTASQQTGHDTFFNVKTTGFAAPATGNIAMVTCNDCHELDPDIERFGSSTLMSFEGTETSQDMKVAHLRNIYTRVGMFGQRFREPTSTHKHMGDQVNGYGFSHDGAADTLETFLSLNVFHVPDDRLMQLIDFVMTMPTGLAPIVGQQVTLTNDRDAQARVDLMIDQALAHTLATGANKPKCELMVTGVVEGKNRAWLMSNDGSFQPDDTSESIATDNELREMALQSGNRLTYTCLPPGTGKRIALDRDEDGTLNAVDSELLGQANTSVQAANPNAAPETDPVVDAKTADYNREQSQIDRGVFPDFEDYWAFSKNTIATFIDLGAAD